MFAELPEHLLARIARWAPHGARGISRALRQTTLNATVTHRTVLLRPTRAWADAFRDAPCALTHLRMHRAGWFGPKIDLTF